MRLSLILLTAALLPAVFGCRGKGPVAVSGEVTLDGQPLERGRIDFQPADGNGPMTAAPIRDGKYEGSVHPGMKTIRITGGKVVGSHPFTPGNPASPMVEDIESLVPPCYNTETTLSCEITRGQSTYDFELKSKP
ncbi:MAG: hypothetical protein JXB10_01370 [Pirellulales bacterium]|nr:hypothetical protein [Pirellulales bacterium]